ncbi:antibiotic biosynthesis monooxygenase family protein [Paenibacillus sp. GCM10027626]|uniref:antibiotic biosynthesis monooxygenase family protein n=1 Tax=Paenibacillus sp. GCM10027626 TaxID=3273411 RepID=UPI00362E28FC
MLIQKRTITVKAGFSDQVVERFGKPGGPMTEIEGFIDLTVMVKKGRRNDEEEQVVVMVRWESEEAWKRWEKSPAHIEGHRNQRNQEKPEYLISTVVDMYEVKAVKLPS